VVRQEGKGRSVEPFITSEFSPSHSLLTLSCTFYSVEQIFMPFESCSIYHKNITNIQFW